MAFLIPDDNAEEDEKGGDLKYSLEYDNRLIFFEQPQFARSTVSVQHIGKTGFPDFQDQGVYRRVFVTCRIACDVPLIRDKIRRRDFYGNARLVSQDVYEDALAVVRINAFFPTPEGVQGDDLSYTANDTLKIGRLTATETSNPRGSRLVDWNRYKYDTTPAVLAFDDYEQLKQLIQLMLDDTPLYEESAEANLGRVDASYIVGDKIVRIVNSELDDGSGGYFGMRLLIERVEFSKVGDTDAFETRLSMKNYLTPTQRRLEDRRF
jgi:hypothetical protein